MKEDEETTEQHERKLQFTNNTISKSPSILKLEHWGALDRKSQSQAIIQRFAIQVRSRICDRQDSQRGPSPAEFTSHLLLLPGHGIPAQPFSTFTGIS